MCGERAQASDLIDDRSERDDHDDPRGQFEGRRRARGVRQGAHDVGERRDSPGRNAKWRKRDATPAGQGRLVDAGIVEARGSFGTFLQEVAPDAERVVAEGAHGGGIGGRGESRDGVGERCGPGIHGLPCLVIGAFRTFPRPLELFGDVAQHGVRAREGVQRVLAQRDDREGDGPHQHVRRDAERELPGIERRLTSDLRPGVVGEWPQRSGRHGQHRDGDDAGTG